MSCILKCDDSVPVCYLVLELCQEVQQQHGCNFPSETVVRRKETHKYGSSVINTYIFYCEVDDTFTCSSSRGWLSSSAANWLVNKHVEKCTTLLPTLPIRCSIMSQHIRHKKA